MKATQDQEIRRGARPTRVTTRNSDREATCEEQPNKQAHQRPNRLSIEPYNITRKPLKKGNPWVYPCIHTFLTVRKVRLDVVMRG